MRIGVVGTGHFGKNYVRIFCELLGPENVSFYDRAPCSEVAKRFPGSTEALGLEELLDTVDGVVVCTPPTTHSSVALQSIIRGKHVLIEKPMAMTGTECEELIQMAGQHSCRLVVGHTFLYNPAVLEAKRQLQDWRFQRIYYMEAFRRHLGLIREDVDAVWDLAAHDIAIFNYWLNSAPLSVQAIGMNFLSEGCADTASIFLHYPGRTKGIIHVSWIDAAKRRDISVVGAQAKLSFNDLDPCVLRIEEKGAIPGGDVDSFDEFKALIRTGDESRVVVEKEEPLKNLCQHFVQVVKGEEKPRTTGRDGQRVVKILQAISVSMRKGGTLEEVLHG